MRRRMLAVLALTAACGNPPPIDPPEDVVPAGLTGSLVVHYPSLDGDDNSTTRVFVGDGSAFVTTLDATGTARFEGTSLTGAPDVTLVAASGDVYVMTGVNRPEVWLENVVGDFKVESTRSAEPRVTHVVSGIASGALAGSEVRVLVDDGQSSDGVLADADGRFEAELSSPALGTVNLVALEFSAAPAKLLKIGAARAVPLQGGQPVVQDLVLSQPADAAFPVALTQVPDLATTKISFALLRGGGPVATSTSRGSAGTTFKTPLLTPPFDLLTRTVEVESGLVSAPGGRALVRQQVSAAATRADLAFLRALTLAGLPLKAEPPYQTIARSALTLSWTADPRTQVLQLMVRVGGRRWHVCASRRPARSAASPCRQPFPTTRRWPPGSPSSR